MSLFTYLILFFAGIFVFALTPALLAPLSAPGWRRRITDPYIDWALAMLGQSLLVWNNPGWILKRARLDKSGEYKITLSGEVKHFADPMELMSRCRGRVFGIAHAGRNVIIDPRICDLGRRKASLSSNGEWEYDESGRTGAETPTVADGGSDQGPTLYKRAYFHLDTGRRIVSIDGALAAIQGSAKPASVNRTRKLVELSQKIWNSTNYVDYITWLASMGVPFGLILLANKVTQGGGPSVIDNLPLVLGVLA